jgi:hypothetical protein
MANAKNYLNMADLENDYDIDFDAKPDYVTLIKRHEKKQEEEKQEEKKQEEKKLEEKKQEEEKQEKERQK